MLIMHSKQDVNLLQIPLNWTVKGKEEDKTNDLISFQN